MITIAKTDGETIQIGSSDISFINITLGPCDEMVSIQDPVTFETKIMIRPTKEFKVWKSTT